MNEVTSLLDRRAELLRFVRARVESDAVAEDILQGALVRALEHEPETDVVAWMYRTLRNAIVDHYRRRRPHEPVPEELEADGIAPDERARTCQCVRSLAKALKPEYAEMLEKVDVEQRPLVDVAAELEINANNAGVRLHRARKALREATLATCKTCAEHGCVDCSCKV